MKQILLLPVLLLGEPVAFEMGFLLVLLAASIGVPPIWRNRKAILTCLDRVTNDFGPQLVYLESPEVEDWPGEQAFSQPPAWPPGFHINDDACAASSANYLRPQDGPHL